MVGSAQPDSGDVGVVDVAGDAGDAGDAGAAGHAGAAGAAGAAGDGGDGGDAFDAGHERRLALWTARALVRWAPLERERSAFLDEALGARARRAPKLPARTPTSARRPQKVPVLVRHLVAIEEEAPPLGGVIAENVALLGDAFGFDALQRELLALAALSETPDLEYLLHAAQGGLARGMHRLLGVMLGVATTAVERALAPGGALLGSGLVEVEYRGASGPPITLHPAVAELIGRRQAGLDGLIEAFCRRAPPAGLGPEAFPQLAAEVALLRDLLGAAVRTGGLGVHVLLHGEPGTGKTELARALASAAGAPLFEVADAGPGGEMASARGRLGSFQAAQRLLAGRGAVLLFDEVEDVLGTVWVSELAGERARTRGKSWMNRLVEGSPVPAIWVANTTAGFDPALLRRFSAVVEVGTPPPEVRRRILEDRLAGLPVRPEWLRKAARDERIVPAHVDRAARVVALLPEAGPERTEGALDRLLDGTFVAAGRFRPAGAAGGEIAGYDLSLLNATPRPEALVEGLRRAPRARVCLHGPPGTGKTAFAWHLADRLGLPLVVKRASDLLGPFVGETEASIAAMFREAAAAGAAVLLDEADGLLGDRGRAHQAWEVTLVNEVLVQVEAFEGLFLAATNRFEDLDAAAFRRFDVSVRFEPLRPEGRWRMLVAAVARGDGEPPAGGGADALRARLDRLDGLTPGDVAAAEREARILGRVGDPGALVTALEEGERRKRRGAAADLGFRCRGLE